jgi:hypothetical protein
MVKGVSHLIVAVSLQTIELGDLKLYIITVYQDVQAMIFVGFGFLMNFLRKYGYSALGITMLIGALSIQWSILCRGFFHHNEQGMIPIDITT